jgi:DNA polymerase-3 subunit gamma/tau
MYYDHFTDNNFNKDPNFTMSYQVLARKWRPKTFDDMVGQSHVLKALSNALDQNRLHHAYLFTGTRGVGKTTLARILAKCLNCEQGVSSKPCGKCNSCIAVDEGRFIDLIEVDAASRTGVDDTRDLLENVAYAPTIGRYKVYLIDEVHMFSKSSFAAILKTLEEPPLHVKFVFATTENKKIPPTVLSRCLQFNLNHLSADQINKQIEMILNAENTAYDKPSIELIARSAAGSMRDALTLLDQAIAHGNGTLRESEVRMLLGTIDSEDLNGLIQSLINSDPEKLLNIIETIALKNLDYDALLAELLSLLQKIAVIQLLPEDSKNILKSDKTLVKFAHAMKKEETQLYYQIGMMGRKDLYFSPDAKSGLEMIMIRMLAFNPTTIDEEIKKKQITNSFKEISDDLNDVPIENKEQKEISETVCINHSGGTWENIINEMQLVGLVNELARNCTLKSQDKNKVELSLSPSYKHILNQNLNSRLAEAIKEKFGSEVKLIITVEESDDESPSSADARVKQELKNVAKEAVKNDPDVKLLQDTFDATIDQDSIQPQ